MAVAEELQILVDAKVGAAVRDLKKTQQQTDKLGKSALGLVKNLLPVAGAAAGLIALARGAKEAEQAFFQQEKSVALLNASLLATGQFSEATSRDMQNFASELQGLTTVGDETSIQLMQVATSAGLSADQAKDATRDAIGLSKAFGIDLQAAIKATTNAQQGNFDLLNRYIPSVKNAKDETEKAAIAQKSLGDAFEVAKAEAETASGVQQQYQNALGDTQEIIGEFVSQGMTPIRRAFRDLLTEINDTIKAKQNLQDVLKNEKNDTESLRDAIATQKEVLEQVRFENDAYNGSLRERVKEEEAILSSLESRLALEASVAEFSALSSSAQKAETEERLRLEEEATDQARRRAEDLRILQEAYAKTDEGAIQAVKAQIAFFEAYKDGPMAQAVLADLNAQLEAMTGNVIVNTDLERTMLESGNALRERRSQIIEENREGMLEEIRLTEELDKRNQALADTVSSGLATAYTSSFAAVGEALATGADASKAFAKAALLGIAGVVDALAAELAARAVIALFTAPALAGPLAAGSAAASVAAGAIRANASGSFFQEGTPQGQPFTVPGTPGRDSQPIMVEPGEEVTVNSRARSARGDSRMANITLNIDGRAFGKLILDLSRDRIVTLDRGALVAT